MDKRARMLRDKYHVSYQTALRLIREKGLEQAEKQCEQWMIEAKQENEVTK